MLSPDSLSTNGTAPAEGLPEVDVVPVPQETIDFGDLEPTCTPAATSWVMPADALFDPYSAVLKDEAKAMLDQAIVEIQENSEITGIEVTGHTASIGIEPSGMELSQKRADAVTNYLANGGIDRSLITAQGVGDAQPACEDWDPVNGVQINPCASSERNVSLTVTGVILCDN